MKLRDIWSFVAEPPRWEEYKDFFHITVFRYLVLWFALVPLVATLLAGLERPLTMSVDGRELTLELALPFSWQLLWLSSFFFFLALVIYHFRCPPLVRKYNNFGEYRSYSHDDRWLAWQAKELLSHNPDALKKFAERLITKDYVKVLPSDFQWTDNPSVEKEQTKFYFRFDGKTLVLSMPVLDEKSAVVDDAAKGVFWEIFGRFSASRHRSRLVIRSLLGLSLICFALVLIQHIGFGLCALWEWSGPLIVSAGSWVLALVR